MNRETSMGTNGLEGGEMPGEHAPDHQWSSSSSLQVHPDAHKKQVVTVVVDHDLQTHSNKGPGIADDVTDYDMASFLEKKDNEMYIVDLKETNDRKPPDFPRADTNGNFVNQERRGSFDTLGGTSGASGDVQSVFTLGGTPTKRLWSRMMPLQRSESDLERGSVYKLNDGPFRNYVQLWWERQRVRWARTIETIRHHPSILFWSFLAFAIILVVGTLVVLQFADSYESDHIAELEGVAERTGTSFSEHLDQAILPLFSLAQFVYEIDEFHELARIIGPVGTLGSLPLLPPRVEGGHYAHRNVTGVCDDPHRVQRFSEIAGTIKKNAQMEGILVNLQLAPMATVCLLHPINNTEDFPPGVFMDNSGAIGHDLFTDVDRKFIAEATIPARRVVTAGPLTLRQCQDCDPTVEKAFIARLPIYMDEYSMEVGGQVYNAYGFSVALINWQTLVERTIDPHSFDSRGMAFELTRTDQKIDSDTGEVIEKVVVLAELHGEDLTEENSVVVSLNTTDNKWEMRVGLRSGLRPTWLAWALTGVGLLAALVFTLLFLVLVNNHAHQDLLQRIFPTRALRKLDRGQTVVEQYRCATVFFSDIVGYTTMSAEMSPMEIMELLNSLYAEMDKLCDKYGVYKIETVGDAYMVTGGCPDRCLSAVGAEKVARFALATLDMVRTFETPTGIQLMMRAGINSGPLVAGVIGAKRPHYTVFGETVNLASRMESTSVKMRVQCSEMTFRLLNDAPNFIFDLEPRGPTKIKGKGSMYTWWINGCTKRGTFS